MNNMHHLLDLKISIAGVLFIALNFSGLDIGLRIIGSIVFIGYNIRRWHIMEKQNQKPKDD